MKGKSASILKYALMCDDIREEKSEKSTLVGVYSEKMFLNIFPAVLPKICFRICFDSSGTIPDKINLSVKTPGKVSVGPIPATIIKEKAGKSEFVLNLALSPFLVETPGEYRLIVGYDETEEVAYRFIAEKP